MNQAVTDELEMAKNPFKSTKVKNKSKRKYPGFRKNLYDYIQEFTDYTGIHGFKYMGEQNRSIFEKLTWSVLFCISLWICISLTIDTWRKWETSPVLVSFAKSPTPVWEIPFPAVTICPETKTRQAVFNFTDAYDRYNFDGNLTEEEMKHLSDSSLICNNHVYNDGSTTTKLDTIDYLMKIAPQFNDVFFSCKWTLLNESCYNLFTPTMTEDGLCFTFNMLDRSEIFREKVMQYKDYMKHDRNAEGWTLENGYPPNTPRDTFPRRAMSAGSAAGLYLVITAYKQDLDYICRGPVQGFKILLHHPSEIPRVSRQYFRVPLNQEVVVSIAPDMMTTSPALVEYEPHRRQCYFPTEKHLAFFQFYTQPNCEVECLANYTLAKCGCVAYYMPRENSTPICGAGSLKCIFEAQNELLEREVEAEISTYDTEDMKTEDSTNCNCLPACTSLSYDAEATQVPYKWEKIFEGFRSDINEFPGDAENNYSTVNGPRLALHYIGISIGIATSFIETNYQTLTCFGLILRSSERHRIQLSRLTVFFKEQQFITSERNELYGLTDFLANCGGILGLFTGFSFLSIVEIVYFLSLRLICNVKRHGRHYWSGSKKLVNSENYVHG